MLKTTFTVFLLMVVLCSANFFNQVKNKVEKGLEKLNVACTVQCSAYWACMVTEGISVSCEYGTAESKSKNCDAKYSRTHGNCDCFKLFWEK